MYADPQTITVNAVAVPLARVGSASPERVGSFSNSDGTIGLVVTQNKTAGRFRREIRINQRKIAADPISAVNKEVSTSIIFTIDEPRTGFSDLELGHLVTALKTYLTDANRDKLLGGEL